MHEKTSIRIPTIIQEEAIVRRVQLTGATVLVGSVLCWCTTEGTALGYDYRQSRYVEVDQ